MNLFEPDRLAGVFRGFTQGGLEFHADIVLEYKTNLQSIPTHGQFVLVQLERENEAVLGRIVSLSSDGRLSSSAGEDFTIRAARENEPIDEEIKKAFLKYRVNIRVLGLVKVEKKKLRFVASHRRLPHLGSKVAFPSDAILAQLVSDDEGAHIGHFALGEYLFCGKHVTADLGGVQAKDPEIKINFNVDNLVSKRSFIFARAGFGKSNLNKLLFSELYKTTPVRKKAGRSVPVGTIIFDPDGEYFWPDENGNPGLCDVEHLHDKLVVFTERESTTSEFYRSFVAGKIKLDIRRLRPADVVGIALGVDRQEQQNVRKLRGLHSDRWEALVNLVHVHRNNAELDVICELMDLDPLKQEMEALAARSNMTAIVAMLHDPASQLLDKLFAALRDGKLCIIDISQMRGQQSLILSGLILKRIFDKNQEEFTNYPSTAIPVIAVVEEAQSVLGGSQASEPYVSWVKEGRKYDLGALLITQQPGSIPNEILSQGDNWFLFHLLSATDLNNVSRANAHFSEDILSSLLNEPIPGQGVFWSSAMKKSYPISLRIRSFSELYKPLDPDRNKAAVATYAIKLRKRLESLIPPKIEPEDIPDKGVEKAVVGDFGETEFQKIKIPQPAEENERPAELDVKAQIEAAAIKEFRDSDWALRLNRKEQAAWGSMKAYFLKILPADLDDRDSMSYALVRKALDHIYGVQNQGWHSERDGRGVTQVRLGAKPGQA